jgi:hypothetical protein
MDTSNGGLTVTVPDDKDAKFPVGAVVVIGNTGTNRKAVVTVVPDTGVSVNDPTVRKIAHNRMVALIKIDADSWIINAGGGNTETVPLEPNLVSVTAAKQSAVVKWEKPKDDGGSPITGYIIERSFDQTGWSFVGSRNDQICEMTLVGLEAGVVLWLRVRAQNTNGVSGPSNAITVTPQG